MCFYDGLSSNRYSTFSGDSYSSTGFYIEGGFPTASNPMGSGGSTTTGGLNWVGMVTEQLNSSLVLTYDFAYYGADISNTIINTGVTTDLIAQVGQFEDNLVPAPTEAPWTADNLLVAVWIGINDIGQCFWQSAQYETCPIDDALTKYFDLLQNLYKDGARNFVVNTVPRKSDQHRAETSELPLYRAVKLTITSPQPSTRLQHSMTSLRLL